MKLCLKRSLPYDNNTWAYHKYKVIKEFIKNEFSSDTTDDFGFCHIYYDEEGKCEAVEIFDDVEVYVGDDIIFPCPLDRAKDIEDTLEEDDEGMLSVEKSIGIYAPDKEVESILFGVKGYYE